MFFYSPEERCKDRKKGKLVVVNHQTNERIDGRGKGKKDAKKGRDEEDEVELETKGEKRGQWERGPKSSGEKTVG